MEEIKKTRRRTRNETNSERNYTCGCGKTYLSYPALYLHLKIKHGGQQPSGTVSHKKVDVFNEQQIFEQQMQFEQKKDGNIIDNTSILMMTKVLNPKQDSLIDFQQAIKIIQQIVIKNNNNETLQCILQNFQLNKINKGEKNSGDLWSSKIYETFAIYLLQSYQYFDEEQFIYIANFIFIFALSLDEDGWKILQKMDINFDRSLVYQKFCLQNNCEHILEISNEFVTDYLPRDLQKYIFEYQRAQIINSFEQNIYMTQYFTDWLYTNTFTNSKLQPQTDIKQN